MHTAFIHNPPQPPYVTHTFKVFAHMLTDAQPWKTHSHTHCHCFKCCYCVCIVGLCCNSRGTRNWTVWLSYQIMEDISNGGSRNAQTFSFLSFPSLIISFSPRRLISPAWLFVTSHLTKPLCPFFIFSPLLPSLVSCWQVLSGSFRFF